MQQILYIQTNLEKLLQKLPHLSIEFNCKMSNSLSNNQI